VPVYKVEGVVLRHQAVGEADRIVTLFTREHGKLRAVARGVRRTTSRLGGRIQPFTHGRFLLAHGRTLDVVAQADVVSAFPGLRTNLLRSAYAAYVAELVDRFLPERDRHEDLFPVVRGTLDVLERAGEDEAEVYALWFALHLAEDLGYRPETERCVACGRPVPRAGGRSAAAWAFSVALGGALCPTCLRRESETIPVAPGVLATCAFLQHVPADRARTLRVAPAQRRELARLVQAHLEYRLEGRLRAPAVIAQLRQAEVAPPSS